MLLNVNDLWHVTIMKSHTFLKIPNRFLNVCDTNLLPLLLLPRPCKFLFFSLTHKKFRKKSLEGFKFILNEILINLMQNVKEQEEESYPHVLVKLKS